MAIITGYTSLQTAVTDYLARSNLSSYTPNFIQNWEERFYRQPKNFGRWMEFSLDVTISSGIAELPTDYLGLKYSYVDGSPASRLDRVSLNQLYGRYPRGGATGRPVWISRELGSFVFGPIPDSDYNIRGVYWAKQTPLRSYASDAAGHWLILNAPDLALYGALLEAEPFLKNDSRIDVWASFYKQSLQDYRDLHSEEDVSGSPVQEVLA